LASFQLRVFHILGCDKGEGSLTKDEKVRHRGRVVNNIDF